MALKLVVSAILRRAGRGRGWRDGSVARFHERIITSLHRKKTLILEDPLLERIGAIYQPPDIRKAVSAIQRYHQAANPHQHSLLTHSLSLIITTNIMLEACSVVLAQVQLTTC